ncbi:MAG: hypothetical protein ACFFCQ_15510 [Promethearchaeota archaeon]
MGVHLESVENLLNQIINSGAILAIIADIDGLPIAIKTSKTMGETEEALSAFASLILEIGNTICQEIQGDFQSSIFKSSNQVIIASVIPDEPPHVFIALSSSDSTFKIYNEMERLIPLVSKSMEGVIVPVEELVSPPFEAVESVPLQDIEVSPEVSQIESGSTIEIAPPMVSEEMPLQQKIEYFFSELEKQVSDCQTKIELGNIFLQAKRNLTMVLGSLSAVGFHMNTFAVKAKRKEQRDPLAKLKREVLVKMDHWKQLLYSSQDL